MNFLKLLTKEKHVAGVEISDSIVRIAFFQEKKKKSTHQPLTQKKDSFNTVPDDELILIEEPIAPNLIEDGVVTDSLMLGKTLKNIWEKANLGTNYAIVAIPDDKVYSKIFSFPKSVNEARITEAMRLAISFQLPINTSDAYLDWEKTEGTDSSNEILLSTVPQKVVQGYISALDFAGIKTLALESSLASIARAIQLAPGEMTLFLKKTPDGATAFALKDGILRFSRTLPARFVPEDKISMEIDNIKKSLESDQGKRVADVKEVSLIDAQIREDYRMFPSITSPQSKWLISLGAAIRGRIPEGQDSMISLLPVGTEEAYSYQKVTTVAIFIRNMTIGISIFFIAAFLFALSFVSMLSQNRAKDVVSLSAGAIPASLPAEEEHINQINALAGMSASLLAKTPIWSTVIDELLNRTTSGIIISNFSAPSIDGMLSLTGIAASRVELNAFKKSLQDSPLFDNVDIPTTNLDLKDSIPFSATFHIKNPGALYYK